MKAVQRIAPVGFWEIAIADRSLYCSDEIYAILGTTPQRLDSAAASLSSFVHADDLPAFQSELERSIENSLPFNVSCRVRQDDGAIRHVRFLAEHDVDANGNAILTGTLQYLAAGVSVSEPIGQARSWLQFAMDIIPVGAWEVELPAGRVLWSDEVCDIHEVPRGTQPTVEEAISFYAPSSREVIRQSFYECVNDGQSFDEVLQIVTAQDNILWVRAIGEPVRAPDGSIMRVRGAFQDLTQQKAFEERALNTARRLQNTLESITDAFYTMDTAWRFTYLNKEAERILQRSRYDLLGKVIWEEFPAASHGVIHDEYHRSMHERCSVSFQTFYSPLGIWVDVRAYPSEEGLTVYFRDVTQEIRSQRALRESEARFHIVAKATSDVVWDWDTKEDSIWWSDNMHVLFGYPGEELEPDIRSWTSRIHPEDVEDITNSITQAIRGGAEKWSGEYRFRRKDGGYAHVFDRGFILRDEEGNAIRMVGSMEDISRQKQTEREVFALAHYDTLTGLPNRRFFWDRLNARLTARAARRRNGALLFLDLDNFKFVNDTYGHDMGDELLRQVGKRISACVRQSDVVARLGGDEFVVLLETLDKDKYQANSQAHQVARKIVKAFSQAFMLADEKVYAGTSIGVAIFKCHETADEVFKSADLALYQAKLAGRNTVRFFDPLMQARISWKTETEAALREGLRAGEFSLYFQPQFNAAGLVVGAEGLLRWTSAKRGVLAPGDFLSVAEESGLIVAVDQWVIEAGCRQLSLWANDPVLGKLTLALNVSGRQFHHSNFADDLLSAIRKSGVDPNRIVIEITEAVLAQHVEDAMGKMAVLKKAGVQFALDDFGTGYSSLLKLKHLPIDQLKIDSSFVKALSIEEQSRAIIQSIIALGKNLKLHVIAEGVEEKEQWERLRQMGCDAFQGHWFSHPLKIEEFESFMKHAGQMPAEV